MAIYDYNIRCALEKSFYNIPDFFSTDTIMVDEFDICGGNSRIDIAVINGQLHGYEIKSERDNLDRLPSQISDYDLVFDTMTIVVSKRHIDKVTKIVPKWWGIQYVTGEANDLRIHTKREAKQNKTIDGFFVAQLLWREELLAILDSQKDIKRNYRSKTRRELALIVSQNLSLEELEENVRRCLKNRQDWKSVALIQQYDDLHNK